MHPESEGLRRGQISFDLLHAHVDGDHKKVKVFPNLMFKQLMQIVVSAEPREHMYKDKGLDVQPRVLSSQAANGKSAIPLVGSKRRLKHKGRDVGAEKQHLGLSFWLSDAPALQVLKSCAGWLEPLIPLSLHQSGLG
jgi:hypothetical protein